MTYDELIPVIRKLAIEAGAKIMEIYNSDDFEVKAKSDDSPVTAADEAADAIIAAGLRAAFPEMALVTEEQAASHATKGDTFLIVDPLDGTKEFIHRRGDLAVDEIPFSGGDIPKVGEQFLLFGLVDLAVGLGRLDHRLEHQPG